MNVRQFRFRAWTGAGLQLMVVGFALAAGLGLQRLIRSEPPGDSTPVSTEPELITSPHASGEDTQIPGAVYESAESSSHPWRARMQVVQDAVRRINRASTESEFRELMELINSLPGDQETQEMMPLSLLTVLFDRWAAIDPQSATRGVTAIVHRRGQYDALQRCVRAWVAREGGEAIAGLLAIPGIASSNGPGIAFEVLSESNPLEALEIHRARFPDNDINRAHSIFSAWSRNDPDGLASWIESALKGNAGTGAGEIESALTALGPHRPETAWSLTSHYPETHAIRINSRRQILSSWLRLDAPAAISAVASVGSPEERRDLFREAGELSVRRTPSPRDEWLKIIPADDAQQSFLKGAASGLARGDGRPESFRTAASLAHNLTDPSSRDAVFREIGRFWSEADAPDASRWLDSQAPGPERDAVIGEFVRGLAKSDPAAAVEWSAAIADPGKRMRRLEELFPQWAAADPVAADTWLQASPALDDGQRNRLQTIPETGDGR